MTGRKKGDLLTQVTVWAGLTVYRELLLLLIQVECQATNFLAISLCEHVTFDTRDV
jgi:hypothetical protein